MSEIRNGEKTTIRDIAALLGISRGTVDRALHNRKGVSAETRERVLKAAREWGYAPNRLAQFLVTRKPVNIAFITRDDPLWRDVITGAQSFVQGPGAHIVNIKWYRQGIETVNDEAVALSRIVEEQADTLEKLINEDIQGIALAPADMTALNPLIRKIIEKNIPVVTVGPDAPRSKRLCFIGQDNTVTGRLAGELMGKFLMGNGRVMAITGYREGMVNNTRLLAFLDILAQRYPGISLIRTVENQYSESETCGHIKAYLSTDPPPDGIYITAGTGLSGAVQALEQFDSTAQVKIIGSHFYRNSVALLKKDRVHALIGPDPFRMGFQTMKILFEHIIDQKPPETDRIFIRTDVGFRENIDALTGNDPNTFH
jgi:LacI family transcriptional regulator